jgi:hypothetical protein
MTETGDDVAQRIAERGRGALVERLRPAFREAADAHADLIELDSDQLEEMVQRAADRADGLQWRRALASVATEELGIGLGEALGHPAVARAQAIVGAPSYEEALAGARGSAPSTQVAPGAEVAAEGEPDEADTPEPEATEEPAPATDPSTVRVNAIHLGGIADLAAAETGLELQLSDDGLDISRGEGTVLGRLPWHEIRGIDVPAPRGVRRRRKRDAQLVVKTSQGEARFAIPAVSTEEFREILAPVLERHRSGQDES